MYKSSHSIENFFIEIKCNIHIYKFIYKLFPYHSHSDSPTVDILFWQAKLLNVIVQIK